jgi:hypothetical protein
VTVISSFRGTAHPLLVVGDSALVEAPCREPRCGLVEDSSVCREMIAERAEQ